MAKNLVSIDLDNTEYSLRPYGTCSTSDATSAKTVNISGFTLCAGATVLIKFTQSNKANNITLNVNSTGAIPVQGLNDVFYQGVYYEFLYDGTNWVEIGERHNHRGSSYTANNNNYPYRRIASTNIVSTTNLNQSTTLILKDPSIRGKYGELCINYYTATEGKTASYEIYWIINKGFSNDHIKIGFIDTPGAVCMDVFYKNPSAWAALIVEQKMGGRKEGAGHFDVNKGEFNFIHSYEVSNTTTTDKLTSYECYKTIEDAAIELYGKAYSIITSPNNGTNTPGKISFNGDLTGNAATATNATNATNATKATQDSDGNVINTTYLKKAGDTMTGDLTIKRNSSDSPAIILQLAETNDTFEDWKLVNAAGYFKIQNRNSGNTWTDVLSLAPSSTKTISSTWNVLPSSNNTLTLGNTNYKWKEVYATTFNGNATTATTATNIKQTVSTSNANYPLLLAPSGQTATNNSGGTYFDSGVTLNPSNNILSGAKVYESLLQWGNTTIANGLSPIDVATDGQWSANRLSFMPASGINIEYSTDGGSTWTDYGSTDAQKQSLVTTGLSNTIYPGKKSTRQLINTDKVRVTITAESGKTYFSLKKIYMYISQNGASDCKVLVEKAQCGSDTTFKEVGTYAISGWSGWNSIPLTANFGGGDTQTGNIRRIRLTFYFEKYSTNYGEAEGTSAVNFYISKINMIGETQWSNSGGSLAATGHLYSWDVNKNATFPANLTTTGALSVAGTSTLNGVLTVKGNTTLGDTTSDTVTISGKATINNGLILKGTAASKPLITRAIIGSDGEGAVGPLHLQYGVNNVVNLGNNGEYSISADGGTYSGAAAKLSQTALALGDDLNTFTTEGVYTSQATNVCQSLVNGPTGRSNGEARLEVTTCGTNHILQTLYTKNATKSQTWYRYCNASSWSEWSQYMIGSEATTAEISALFN